MRSGIVMLSTLAGAIAVPLAAEASSPDAWKEFNAQVEQKCGEAAADLLRKPQVAVDPVGSDRFGLAIVYGRSKEVKGRAAFICVVDKKTGVVEIGTELSNDLVRVRKPKDDDDKGNDDDDAGGSSGN